MCQNTTHKICQMALYKEQEGTIREEEGWDKQTQDIPPGGLVFLSNVKPRLYVDLF